ncbi:MAG: hypothetical protein WB952_08100 [Terriglobales bacterium]
MTITELKEQRRWVLHRSKIPHQPNGCRAKSNAPATWSTFAECSVVMSGFSGVGVVTGNGVCSVEFDDVLTDGQLTPEVQEIVAQLSSYTEVTPSKTGLLVLVCGTLPGPGIAKPLTLTSAIEIKAEGFFHTFTGNHLDGTPLVLMDRQAELEALYERFRSPVSKAVSEGARPRVSGSIERQIHLLEKWAESFGFPPIQFVKDPDGSGAVTVVLEHCPRDESHDGTSAGLIFFPDGGRASCCHHTSCRSLKFREWWAEVEARLGHKLTFNRELIRR